MAATKAIPPETDTERTEVSTSNLDALTVLIDFRDCADHDLVEQDNRAWLALPGRDCAGGNWTPCVEPGAWEVRGYVDRAFCTYHAAARLRIADQLTGVAR
ncbi:hypothetical protein SAMN05216215_110710 [Saccharopolyspora shandongensis]|uniref:Uncharacterized protein n=1 Tax=Saccharopolyspora shandongensis TaxID=418495 RepID=A0A1H3U3Z9_9PSEU|nr:hypothetical protein [Saccharopolyspora shandongensis]SDZ57204.1 hypothetical protein SAMN05216215_110710 [Saccharopolyspora shandongensis]